MATSKTRLYLNTMIFSIMSGVVSLVLLVLLMLKSQTVSDYSYLIITVEFGLIAVVVTAVLRIVSYENKMKTQLRNALENKLAVKSCPDYWTAKENADRSVTCGNWYVAPDDSASYIMESRRMKIDLSDYDKKPLNQLCKEVDELQAPWTNVRSVCDAYNLSTS